MAVLSVKSRQTVDPNLYEQYKKSDSSLIYVSTNHTEEFSIELTMGDQWADDISRDKPVMYAVEDGRVMLKPNSSIVVEVAEKIQVPFNMYGLIVPTSVTFLEQGIIIGAGKIDPSYCGHLKILLYNTSNVRRSVTIGKKIASAIFFRTDRTITASLPSPREDVIAKRRGSLTRFKDFLLSDPKFTLQLVVTALTSSVVAALITIIVMRSSQSSVGNPSLRQTNAQEEKTR
jgi:dUTPase